MRETETTRRYKIMVKNKQTYDWLIAALELRHVRYEVDIEPWLIMPGASTDEPFSFKMDIKTRWYEDETFQLAMNGAQDAFMSISLIDQFDDKPIQVPKRDSDGKDPV